MRVLLMRASLVVAPAAAIGPGKADQQDAPVAEAAGGTKVYTTRMTIGRALRPVRVRAH